MLIPHRGDTYTLDDIDRFLEEGVVESERLDYKADPHLWPDPRIDPPTKLQGITAKVVSAFGNSGGGTLLLGVDEGPNGEPVRTAPPGLPAQIGKDPVVERVDRMITRCTMPRAPATVRRVPIPHGDRAYVIVDVAARGGGPHRVVDTGDPSLDNRYFVRQGRSSVVADHYQLRQMFAESAEGGARLRAYLDSQGFGDPYGSAFGRRPPASLLSTEDNRRAVGGVIITAIPDVLRGNVLDTDTEAIRAILDLAGAASRFGHEIRPTREGRAIEETRRPPPLLRSYLHVHRNGYLEAGHAAAYEVTDHGKYVLADGVEAMLNPFLLIASRLYEAAAIRDHVFVSVHVRDAMDTRLGLRVAGAGVSGKGYCTFPNLTVSLPLAVDDLTAPQTRALLDRRLANTYGIEEGLVLAADGAELPKRIFT